MNEASLTVTLRAAEIKLLVAALHDVADLQREEPERLSGLDCDYNIGGPLADRLHLMVTDDADYIAESPADEDED